MKFAIDGVQTFVKDTLHMVRDSGGCNSDILARGFQCLAKLQPPGSPKTLDSRVSFCADCLEALLPQEEGLMELKLQLKKGEILGSAIVGLSTFSESGVRAGMLRQVLSVQFDADPAEDAGGPRRQFFDEFPQVRSSRPFSPASASIWDAQPDANVSAAD